MRDASESQGLSGEGAFYMRHGPKADNHHAIHEAAHQQASALIERAMQVKDEAPGMFSDVVHEFLDLIDARILVHAAVEELEVYQPWIEDRIKRPAVIAALLGEHQTLRQLAVALERSVAGTDTDLTLSYMHRFLAASRAHADHEEDVLRILDEGGLPT
ncbi:hemerythrin domain-containing protein [Sulfobacillus harzensis]|uniref:Hemerythrin domain-containing protein n=1 Tax=Sulfobacillus harzensis TaxID=2729629 RepID=A0A7Y0Q3R5_9FIRM|nr:hemerythrin domain-containing protein [Sulfobacillus harzensis]NMP23266.1 hemerythrin domain-containing protein [Sulfobacillus harzensis]